MKKGKQNTPEKVLGYMPFSVFKPMYMNALQVYSYEERISHCTHPIAKRLLSIMSEKHTNLAFSADLTSSEELLKVTPFT